MRTLYAAVLLLAAAGLAAPALAQSVVINEVELNPRGDDSATIAEWVELYNPTNSSVYLGSWQVASTAGFERTLWIHEGTSIRPGEHQLHNFQASWFVDSAESVELRDRAGAVVDKTPPLTDTRDDRHTWQRIYDGLDTDSADDWHFAPSTIGAAVEAPAAEAESEGVSITLEPSMPSYVLGGTAVVSGTVSERVIVTTPVFTPEVITVTITGPGYEDAVTLNPDFGLGYSASIPLNPVFGISAGTYEVAASYAGAEAAASFDVGLEEAEEAAEDVPELSVSVDRPMYIPGQTVRIEGTATSVAPLEGVDFAITGPGGEVITENRLFPSGGEFRTSHFVSTVGPLIGNHTVRAAYGGESVTATFEVAEDAKEDVPISLAADRPAYGLGDTVKITGRLNDVWVSTLDIEVVQTKQTSLSRAGGSGFKVLDGMQVAGDGSFSHSFEIPDNPLRLGEYRVTVSKDVGTATLIVSAVEDPGTFDPTGDPITAGTGRTEYKIGEELAVSGIVADPSGRPGYPADSPVMITITRADGEPLKTVGEPGSRQGSVTDVYELTAVPDGSGAYSATVELARSIFSGGGHVVTASYGGDSAAASFELEDLPTHGEEPILATDRDVYGLGETVSLSGVLPPSGATSVGLSLVRPDGTRINSGAVVDDQRFSWEWTAPTAERYQHIKSDEGREGNTSNFGTYRIIVSTDSFSRSVFFKVSADPENDSLSEEPVTVGTEKALYRIGEKLRVVGSVMVSEQGSEGLVVPKRVTVEIFDGKFPYKQIYQSKVYPDQGGEYSSLFDLPATVFPAGEYTVRATYESERARSSFGVANDILLDSDAELELLVSLDRDSYAPGDTVIVTARPSKPVYIDGYDVSLVRQVEGAPVCGPAYCGERVGPAASIRPGPSGNLVHELAVPASDPAGSYEVTVDADFDTASVTFDVAVPEAGMAEGGSAEGGGMEGDGMEGDGMDGDGMEGGAAEDGPAEAAGAPAGTLVEKHNRIPDREVPVRAAAKTVDSVHVAPRVVSGSLITPDRNDAPDVNLQVTSEAGTCVIGPGDGCLVGASTRGPGRIYETVEVDGMMLDVRYGGPDARLEKFSIVPAEPGAFLPDATWGVEVLKDEQVSRFYYKITFKEAQPQDGAAGPAP